MAPEEYSLFFKNHYRRTSSFLSGIMLMCVDALALFLTIGLSFFIINSINNAFINFKSFVNYSVYLPLILAVFYAAGLYPGIMISPADEVKRMSICSFFSFFGISISILVEQHDDQIALIIAFILAVPIATFLLPAAREIARRTFGKYAWWGVPAVIYATGDSGNEIVNRLLRRPDLGNRPAIIINSDPHAPAAYMGIPVFAPSNEIDAVLKGLGIKVAILCDYEGEQNTILTRYRYTISVSRNQDILTGSMQLKDFAGIIGFSSTHELTKRGSLFLKRLIDLTLLILMSPFVLAVTGIIALLVKITTPGPVFYGHLRVGKDHKPLKCWKFRSMYRDADKQLDKILSENPAMRAEWEKDRKFINDPRVTPLGKFLRKTSLDELPQLFNILTGEMSFVGPRPVTEGELAKYGDKVDFILSVKPGLSGMWQTSGRSDTGYEERITLDTYYIQNWSIWLDFWIIIKTVWVVIKGKGAY